MNDTFGFVHNGWREVRLEVQLIIHECEYEHEWHFGFVHNGWREGEVGNLVNLYSWAWIYEYEWCSGFLITQWLMGRREPIQIDHHTPAGVAQQQDLANTVRILLTTRYGPVHGWWSLQWYMAKSFMNRL